MEIDVSNFWGQDLAKAWYGHWRSRRQKSTELEGNLNLEYVHGTSGSYPSLASPSRRFHPVDHESRTATSTAGPDDDPYWRGRFPNRLWHLDGKAPSTPELIPNSHEERRETVPPLCTCQASNVRKRGKREDWHGS